MSFEEKMEQRRATYSDYRFMLALGIAFVVVISVYWQCIPGGFFPPGSTVNKCMRVVWWGSGIVFLYIGWRADGLRKNFVGNLMGFCFGPFALLTIGLYGLSMKLFPNKKG